MAEINFQCRDCNLEWAGNEFTSACPECQSRNFKKKTPLVTLKYVGIVIVLVVTGLIFIFALRGRNQAPTNSTYVILADQVEDFIQVDIERHFEMEGEQKSERLDGTMLYAIMDHFQIRNRNGGRVTFQNGNRIYPCADGDLFLSWNNSVSFLLKHPNDTVMLVSFKLPASGPNPKANCGEVAQLEITVVKAIAPCSLQVTTNLNGNFKAWVSLSGRKGPYQLTEKCPFPGASYKADVWAFEEGKDTIHTPPVPWILNGDLLYPSGCGSCNEAQKQKLKREFTQVANAFGQAPDREATRPFNSFLVQNSADLKVLLNGTPLDDGLPGFLNKLRTEFLNEGKRFRLKAGSVTVNADCKITKFEFVENVNG
jgi:hypothetical protein